MNMAVYCFYASEDHMVYELGVCCDLRLADYCCSGISSSDCFARCCNDFLQIPERFALIFDHFYSNVDSFDYYHATPCYLSCHYYLLRKIETKNENYIPSLSLSLLL